MIIHSQVHYTLRCTLFSTKIKGFIILTLYPHHSLSLPLTDQLIQLVEVLGSHSIVTAELKQIIGALRMTEDRQLPSYYYRLQQSLCSMAQTKEGVTPLYYFDLRQPESHIAIPDLQSWPNPSGFTFHAWVCLNAPSSLGRPPSLDISERVFRCRRTLYRYWELAAILNN